MNICPRFKNQRYFTKNAPLEKPKKFLRLGTVDFEQEETYLNQSISGTPISFYQPQTASASFETWNVAQERGLISAGVLNARADWCVDPQILEGRER